MDYERGSIETGTERREFWAGSSIEQKISRQKERGVVPPRALLTDRDGTFSMMTAESSALTKHDAATKKLTEYVNERGYLLMVNTGGSIGMMEGGYRDGSLPLFDAAIVAAGSELYIQKDGHYVRDPEFQRQLEELTGYDRDVLHPLTSELLHHHRNLGRMEFLPRDSQANINNWAAHRSNPETIPAPTDIEPPEQNKISFYVYGDESTARIMVDNTRRWLDQHEFPKVKISLARDIYADESRFQINIIPLDKREASDLLLRELTETFGPLTVATAGDADNDIEMVLQSGQAGIAVGNMEPGLRAAIEQAPSQRTTKHFSIVDGRLIYHDPEPTRTVAESLLKGVRALELADRLIQNRSTNDEPS